MGSLRLNASKADAKKFAGITNDKQWLEFEV